ncbi:hypothetical protein THAOC_26033, partial [Thalassiosira oceanica]
MYDLQIIRVHQDPTRYRYNYVSGKQVVQQRKTAGTAGRCRQGVEGEGERRNLLVATGLDKLRPSQLESAAGPEFATSKHKYYNMSLVDVQQRQLQSRVSAEDALAGLSGQMMLVSETIRDLR